MEKLVRCSATLAHEWPNGFLKQSDPISRPKGRFGVGGAVDLCVLRVCQGLHKKNLITVMCGDAMAKTSYDHLIVAFYLPVSLWMVYSRFRVFGTKMGTQVANTFADKLCTITSRKI